MSQNRAFPSFSRAVSSSTKSLRLAGGATAVRRGGGDDAVGSAAVGGGLLVMASSGAGFSAGPASMRLPPTIGDTKIRTSSNRTTLFRGKLSSNLGQTRLHVPNNPANRVFIAPPLWVRAQHARTHKPSRH